MHSKFKSGSTNSINGFLGSLLSNLVQFPLLLFLSSGYICFHTLVLPEIEHKFSSKINRVLLGNQYSLSFSFFKKYIYMIKIKVSLGPIIIYIYNENNNT